MPDQLPTLFAGTVCVPNLAAALALYVDQLEQRVVSRSPVSTDEAAAWQAGAMAGAPSAVLQPPSGAGVYLRLIETPTAPGHLGGRHYGWTALELTVKSADEVHARLVKAGVPIIAAPKPLSFTDKLYPMQARGPGGEALYLNEVRGSLPSSDLPSANCWVDKLFIAVMGCRDKQVTLNFYNALLGTSAGGHWEIPYSVINITFGLPLSTTHALATVADGRHVLFEIDQFPPAARPALRLANALPTGVAIVSVAVAGPPNHAEWLTPPAKRSSAPYDSRTVGVIRGPDGELTELVW